MTPTGLASNTPVGRAAIAAVTVERSIGRPVFLRYTDDADSEGGLFETVAGGIELAVGCLGVAGSVYATSYTDGDGRLGYLTVTVRCADGAVAQIGAGISSGQGGAPGLLLIGDQGTLESNPAAGGVVYEGDRPGIPLRDAREATRREVDRDAGDAGDAGRARQRQLATVVAAILRSLASGAPEAVEAREGPA